MKNRINEIIFRKINHFDEIDFNNIEDIVCYKQLHYKTNDDIILENANDYTIDKVIVNVDTNKIIDENIVNDILNKIRSNFTKDINIIYGIYYIEIEEIIVDVFVFKS